MAATGTSSLGSAPQSSANLRSALIAAVAIFAIGLHLVLRFVFGTTATLLGLPAVDLPLIFGLIVGGTPLVIELLDRLWHRQFGSDLLAGLSIVTALILGEYLAGVLVVLMLSGGEALEAYAVRSASGVLEALAKRLPQVAHRQTPQGIVDVALADVAVGETVVVFPHEICAVDGTVIDGRGTMDESYLTGEPYLISKAPGSEVLSGAINGASALTIRAERPAQDSRYAKIMEVMRASEQQRPALRRIGDQLGALYTPLAVLIAVIAWFASGDVTRFLAVLVVATPCPLLIAIPVAIIGSISLAARRAIIIRDPAILEQVGTCRTAIFDKTGTLTSGKPAVTAIHTAPGQQESALIHKVASLEQYSKHPLAGPIIEWARARNLSIDVADRVEEKPGQGLLGEVAGSTVRVTHRRQWLAEHPEDEPLLPARTVGLECVVAIDGQFAGTVQFRDEPRPEGASFIRHLGPHHQINRMLLVSGDRASEVEYLAQQVGIEIVHSAQSPEQKLQIVRDETERARTIFLGDGINDAPAMTSATVGIAFGQNSDVTAEAAGAVIMESSLAKVDELLHIGARMRQIILQSALGGIVLSLGGMTAAALGYLPPVAGAIFQEVIDVAAVLNALRAAWPPSKLTDYGR